MSCEYHSPDCVGTIWCEICRATKNVHTHSHPVKQWKEFREMQEGER